jgi:glucose/arabinose dehydrogenase
MRRAAALLALLLCAAAPDAASPYADWRADAPGRVHRFAPADLPPAYLTPSASNGPAIVTRPTGAWPRVPAGFAVALYADGLEMPRVLRVAPDGLVFLAETGGGRIRVFRPDAGLDGPAQGSVFAEGLHAPYGIAFYPPGPAPRFVYVADTDRLLRFPWHPDALLPDGPGEPIGPPLPQGGHDLRDVVVAPDGKRLFLAIGSASNDTAPPPLVAADLAAFEATHGRGAAWGEDVDRADVISLAPDGTKWHPYATGLRNCSGLAIQPSSGQPWCVVNERDGLGDDLPPDYVTRLRPGAFYGWPWFYIGDHADPRHAGARPDLAGHVQLPDLLLQPHSAPLGIAFASGPMLPHGWRGDAFVTLHGSWNRRTRTGYKVIRIPLGDGVPTGGYEDFLTGFATADGIWGRPVGIAVARDGALLVSEDANGTIWRISRVAPGH